MQELLNEIPDAEWFLSLAPDELAGRIIVLLNKRFSKPADKFHPVNLGNELWPRATVGPRYEDAREGEVRLAFIEAWAALERSGLIVPSPASLNEGWRVISRRGRSVTTVQQFDELRRVTAVPREFLHPSFSETVWVSLVRQDYSLAVFQAMRAVEIAVREASNFGEGEHGVPMIRKAFHPTNGPLTDLNAQEGEREALSALVSGAIGSYKNPHSHRNVKLDDPVEALEMIVLASHLLRIVDARAGR